MGAEKPANPRFIKPTSCVPKPCSRPPCTSFAVRSHVQPGRNCSCAPTSGMTHIAKHGSPTRHSIDAHVDH
eukprot:15445748-Alexandrium_andersonii.AAC.1